MQCMQCNVWFAGFLWPFFFVISKLNPTQIKGLSSKLSLRDFRTSELVKKGNFVKEEKNGKNIPCKQNKVCVIFYMDLSTWQDCVVHTLSVLAGKPPAIYHYLIKNVPNCSWQFNFFISKQTLSAMGEEGSYLVNMSLHEVRTADMAFKIGSSTIGNWKNSRNLCRIQYLRPLLCRRKNPWN